jgi:hypothetical protein
MSNVATPPSVGVMAWEYASGILTLIYIIRNRMHLKTDWS